ncbi:MAG: family 20 glycosylhydrolase, partial [Spirochaetia bacterium]|nr:family 20 glycosylhydrolase [Spirochaetia bacterium]
SISPTQIRLVIDGTLKEDRDAMIEYIPLAIPALFMEEARVENEGGAAITVGASLSEIGVESRRLTIRSKIGTIVIEAIKGPGFKMVDRRAKPYKGREIFIFTVATSPSLAKGERFYHEMTLTATGDFKSFAELPSLTPAGGSVRFRSPEKIQLAPLSKEIFPKPKNLSVGAESVLLPDAFGIAAESPQKSERFAALLAELFAATSMPRTAKADPKGWIKVKNVTPPKTNAFDYYELSVTKNGATIGAASDAAVYYALSTLVQLQDGAGSLRLAEVKDWADFRYRAIHILADDHSLPLHSLLISNVFGPLRINHLMFECEYVKWPSHPEMHQSWGMKPEEVRTLVRLANEHFIEVSPVFQTYGHCEYLFKDKNNLEIAEDTGAPYAYNVSNPRTYEIIGDLFADMRKIFLAPAFLHIGHDEVTIRGKYPARPENLNTSLADLLWKDLGYYESYAKKESLSLMLWQDYLNGRSHPEHREALLGVAKKMNKNSVIAVWDYRPAADFPEVDEFQALGFRVVGATGEEDVANLVNFSRYGKKKNIFGMLHTTWTGYSGNAQSMFRYAKKMWPYIQAG